MPWVELFPAAIRTQAGDALTRAKTILALRDRYLEEVVGMGTAKAIDAVDLICQSPVLTARLMEQRLGVSRPTALRLSRRLEKRGVLREQARGTRGSGITWQRR